ncbi:PREDICTED: F-box/FBD/LRR-repeat protein At5g56420-like [Erythranthe guttata]|uniref:F-box/FBD/LRR-repeat protein At5g56420-like n=1 Tax=Erythranthe guttata TaxID=4155 RepID=UPI00064DD32D|nr:PREDICTED: F-box/FBD/LRR-repeat protein At5g56420-like [Erythranthe guttata]|eukprot:XP_012832861.1 PREDICTED: F-box/FBD/LRR-repeat protein At5g56420-like [Erythranthe guttata]
MAIMERDRRSRQKQNTVPIDRLSDLPDSILTHILSFLPTKFSVRTSILGQRWRFPWAYVSNLIFRDDSQKSINRVLLLRKMQKVNTFCLSDDDDRYRYINKENGAQCKKYQIDTDTWITLAVERNVQILHLCYSSWRDEDFLLGLPGCLFTCKTLVHLKLESCGIIPVRVAVCFPRLEKLHLLYVQYEADESLPNLLSGCPVLEDMEVFAFVVLNISLVKKQKDGRNHHNKCLRVFYRILES